jgi:hypothetical protein
MHSHESISVTNASVQQVPADVTFDKATESLSMSEFEQVFGEMLFGMANAEDASLLVQTLQRLTKTIPGFWFQVWQDSHCTLTGAVWQTPRQKERLAAFGQTIFFDATCSTNKVHALFRVSCLCCCMYAWCLPRRWGLRIGHPEA